MPSGTRALRSWPTLPFDSGHPNAYAARGHTGPRFPAKITIRRYDESVRLDGSATWLLLDGAPTAFTLAFADGQRLSSLRLCVDRKRDGTVDAASRPFGVAEGAAARDDAPPAISARIVARHGARVELALVVADRGRPRSGVAGVW